MGGHNMKCAVRGCSSSLKMNRQLRFISLPAEMSRRKKWISLIGREDILEKSTHHTSHRICALHFHPSVLKTRRIHSQALPSLNLPEQDDTSPDHNNKPPELSFTYEIDVTTDSPKKSFTVETQTERLPVTIFREANTQTDDIGLGHIVCLKYEIEEEELSEDELSDIETMDSDFLLELESISDALLNVKIPIDSNDSRTPL